MKKLFFELLISPLSISDNYYLNSIIMALIGLIAFMIAFKVVGDLGFRGGIGSLFHWIIRFLVFIVLCFLCSIAIKINEFVFNHKELILFFCCSILLAFVVYKIVYYQKSKLLAK